MGLSLEKLNELQAKKRVRGEYDDSLGELIESDEFGVDVAEQWPKYATKNGSTLYQGFRNAAKKAFGEDWESVLDIMQRDEHVFILVKARVEVVQAEQANGASTNGASPAADDNATAVSEDNGTEIEGLV